MTDMDALTEAVGRIYCDNAVAGEVVCSMHREVAGLWVTAHVHPLLAAAEAEGFKQGWDECAAACGPAVLAESADWPDTAGLSSAEPLVPDPRGSGTP